MKGTYDFRPVMTQVQNLVYARNNPLNITDPTGLHLYLASKEASNTFQEKTGGYDKNGNAQKVLVQGTPDKDKNFTTPQIENHKDGNLAEKTTGTCQSVDHVTENGVSFAQVSGVNSKPWSGGVFVNSDTNPRSTAANILGASLTKGYSFTFTNSKMEAIQTTKPVSVGGYPAFVRRSALDSDFAW